MGINIKNSIVSTAVIFSLLTAVSLPHIGQEPAPLPKVRPVSAITQEYRVLPPPNPVSTLVGEETANVVSDSTLLTEIDSEPPKPSDRPAILIPKEPPMDNLTPEHSLPQTTATVTPAEPKMGDTRIVDGQKQVHFLGFGWIKDNDEPNECIYAEDMYENGNKIGSMCGGAFVDGDGDINKVVGTMDGSEVGRSCGDINKAVGSMD